MQLSNLPHIDAPKLRGVSHHVAFLVSLVAGTWLVSRADLPAQQAAAVVFGLGLSLCLGVSASYHRGRWAPRARVIMQKLDHSMIFVLVAASYTPICMLALRGPWAGVLLVLVWLAALVGVVLRLCWRDMPRWALVSTYMGVGLVGVAFLPAVRASLDGTSFLLLAAGGTLYTVGAVIYLLRRPNPFPRVFGFHEVFHVLVIAAASCHYAAVYPLVASPV